MTSTAILMLDYQVALCEEVPLSSVGAGRTVRRDASSSMLNACSRLRGPPPRRSCTYASHLTRATNCVQIAQLDSMCT